ncbi:MAG: COP23 domain-containing protein [Rhizonema sp. PD37]|nr:COP23 domain-containing protein [Rhizonema sp. PD37]
MKLGLFAKIISVIGLTLGSNFTVTELSYAQSNQSSKFFCGMSRGVPATLVRTSRGNIPMVRWVDTAFPKPWTPEQRCEEISGRFQRFYQNGTLNFLRAGMLRNQPVLCVASEKGGPCLPDGVLVTLKPKANPQETLEQLLDYRGGSSNGIVELSGNSKFVYSVNDAAYLSVEKILAQMEGGAKSRTCPAGQPVWQC